MATALGRYTAKTTYENGSRIPFTMNTTGPYDYYTKTYTETGIEITKILPDGSAEAKIVTPAGDTNYVGDGGDWRPEDYPWYSFDGGATKTYLNSLARTGSRTNKYNKNNGFIWSEKIVIPAGTTKITVGGCLDWDLAYEVKNSKREIRNNYYDTSPPIYIVGNLSGGRIVVPYPGYSTSLPTTGYKSKPLNSKLALDLVCHPVDQEAYTYCSSKSLDKGKQMWDTDVGVFYVTDWTHESWTVPDDYYIKEWAGNTYEYWAQVYIWVVNRSWVHISGDIDLTLEKIEMKDLKVYNIYPSGKKELMKKQPDINEYNDEATPYWKEVDTQEYKVSNCTFVSDTGKSKSITIKNGQTYTDFGTYSFTVTTYLKGDSASNGKSYSYTFKVKDNTPPKKPKIVDDKDPVKIIYDQTGRLYLGPCYPTVKDRQANVDYEAELTFYPYTDNCGTLSNTAQYKNAYYVLGSELKESGYYILKVTATKQNNGLTATREVNFYIDNMPPDPPIINVAGVDYQGVYGEVAKIPNPVVVEIKVQKGCTYEQEVYFKKRNKDKWVKISPLMVYSDKGYYKVRAIATKTRNGLKSDWSEVVFQKKIKYKWLITIDPNGKCYRTIATIHFDNDYSLKKMYKINDGEWKWYLGPVFIYENCTIYAKSLDGDDDYESEITSKVIDVIDTSAPAPAKLNVNNGDVGSIFVPNIIT